MKGNWCKRSQGHHDGYKDYLIVRQNLTSRLFFAMMSFTAGYGFVLERCVSGVHCGIGTVPGTGVAHSGEIWN